MAMNAIYRVLFICHCLYLPSSGSQPVCFFQCSSIPNRKVQNSVYARLFFEEETTLIVLSLVVMLTYFVLK